MTALLERLNASRRFARSVYAPHKLALRQSVPSALRAVGVTAPAPQMMSASRSVAPWVLGNTAPRVIAAAAPVVTRAEAVPPGAARRPNALAVDSVALEPQPATPLEPQEPQYLEPQELQYLEPQGSQYLEPREFSNPDLLLEDTTFSDAPLEFAPDPSPEVAAPANLAPSEPLELAADVVANPSLEQRVETLSAQTLLDQPSADPDPIRVQPNASQKPSAEPIAPALRVTETQVMTEPRLSMPEARVLAAAPQGAAAERLESVRENESDFERSPEHARAVDASVIPQTLAAAPAQPLESQPTIVELVSIESQPAAPDLEGLGNAPVTSAPVANEPVTSAPVANEPVTSAPVANEPVTNEPVTNELSTKKSAPLETLQASPAPEVIAPSVAAPVSLEVAADQPTPSPAPIQTTVRGRVIEEFQARPPRNMPPRNLNLRVAEPAAAPEPAASETPRRSPEEWARLLRQRFARPGDEAFDDAPVPQAPETAPQAPETARLEAAPGDSQTVTTATASLEQAAAALEGQASPSLTPALTTESSEPLSAESIRERSQSALQAIPEDMSQRTPRDWGLALIRRYASVDEAAAIGIEAYRDPNDPAPTPAAVQASSLSTALPSSPRVVSSVPISSRTASDSTASSNMTVSSRLIAPALPESAVSPARRFVAPRTAVSSTAPSVKAIAPLPIAPVQAGLVQTQPVAPQPSPAPLEQPSRTPEVAPQIPASLDSSRPASSLFVRPLLEDQDPAVDVPLRPTLETENFAASQIDVAPVDVNDAQIARAAISERPASDVAPSVTPRATALPDMPAATPSLEPVTLSGATRRFLEPLVGFDPNEVSVYSGEAASRLTRDLRADAAAQDGAVLLPDASNLETPAQLGLLAHELIHAARQQQSASQPQPDAVTTDSTLENTNLEISALAQPALETPHSLDSAPRRFVPAVGSSDTRSARQPSSVGQPIRFSNAVRQSRAPLLSDINSFESEEDRARAAEARVVQIARAESLSADPTIPDAAPSWNGLPAPWESLPSFESSPSDDGVVSLIGAGLSPQGWGGSATTTNPAGYGGSVSSSNPSASNSVATNAGSSASSSSSANSAAQAAEVGRELPEAAGAAAGGQDLEQLAKQVYDVLKRRLQSDRRRGGL